LRRSRLSGAPLRKSYALHRSRDTNKAPASSDHGSTCLIGAEVVDSFDRQQLGKLDARAVDAALHGADCAAADLRGLLVGEARGTDQDQGFALIRRQLRQRLLEFLELDPAVLFRMRLQRFCETAVAIFDLAPAFTVFGAKQVAQDGEQPRWQVGPGFERINVRERAQQRLLHQVVGAVDIAR
jgi:hypothetical protein